VTLAHLLVRKEVQFAAPEGFSMVMTSRLSPTRDRCQPADPVLVSIKACIPFYDFCIMPQVRPQVNSNLPLLCWQASHQAPYYAQSFMPMKTYPENTQ
jgi:hypothetical protein